MRTMRKSCARNRCAVESLEPRRLLSVTLPDDVSAVPAVGLNLEWFTDANGTLLFVHNDGRHGAELYWSNGTADTTGILRDINPALGVGSNLLFLKNVDGT